MGNSGCKLYLIQTDKGLVVRKISSSIDYNRRLEIQCDKQIKSQLLTPEVYYIGYINDLFYFDMEYIQGMQLSEYIKKIKVSDCLEFIQPFLSFIPDRLIYNINAGDIFKNKIASLPNNDIITRKAVSMLKGVDWCLIPVSKCHGDLTLENILVQDDKLYMIDFLDSFYDSWMLDLAKLFQDIELRWAYRNGIDENTNIRLLIIKHYFVQEIRKRVDGDVIMYMLYKLLILNLLRIIPYTRNKVDRAFVYTALERIL